MAFVEELIRKESDDTISFGNYTLKNKSKISDFEHQGDLYKVKTYDKITKLEKNGLFVYESVPGTAVFNFFARNSDVSFEVAGNDTVQITLELEAESEYEIYRDDMQLGRMKTNLGGKLVFSLDLEEGKKVKIKVVKV
ncbi:MAG: endosialidase [Clostridiales bacterium]|nr:endosialidase [Clostridiales bacterium]